ncbi:MAG: AbrB/MazE/SpoVT family DNA-binding domain-containing protein [Bacilli bacterium]|nr:AbrB/MazE/SpoVT family DNA-binding domain-containing protein [Bacilli bacterium]
MKDIIKNDRFIVSVKVGPKGQITIPVEARKMFDIKEGDTLMVMGDKNRGIALLKDDLFYDLMGGMMPNDSNKDN